jgi:lysophospholipase L1-like esterase
MDCLALQPDVLSILIGVNDYWHTLSGGYKGTVEIYENDLRDLLKYTKEKLPNVRFVICEPFALKGGSAIENQVGSLLAYMSVGSQRNFGSSQCSLQ